MGSEIAITADGDDPAEEVRQALSLVDTTGLDRIEIRLVPEEDGHADDDADSDDSLPDYSFALHSKAHAALAAMVRSEYLTTADIAERTGISDESAQSVVSHLYRDDPHLFKRRKAAEGGRYEYLLSEAGQRVRNQLPDPDRGE
jgi:hypothetical protein